MDPLVVVSAVDPGDVESNGLVGSSYGPGGCERAGIDQGRVREMLPGRDPPLDKHVRRVVFTIKSALLACPFSLV